MAISDRTRKLLWGNSGNRCAHCFGVLSVDATELDDPSIVGDECHIISEKLGGPRYDPDFPPEEVNEYANLILLCRVHHKIADDQTRTFDVATLKRMKDDHERRVAHALDLAPLDGGTSSNADPRDLLDSYVRSFVVFHTADLPALVATPMRLDGATVTTLDFADSLDLGHVMLSGVSGSGKSHLLRHMALRAADRGAIPVFARASVYSGSMERMLDQAVAPFHAGGYDAIRKAAVLAGNRLCIMIDALNECPPMLRDLLRESVVALARSDGHVIWVTSSDEANLTPSLHASAAAMTHLTNADKTALLASYAPGVTVDPSALAAFTTPLEIALAAETVRQNAGPLSATNSYRATPRNAWRRRSAHCRRMHSPSGSRRR